MTRVGRAGAAAAVLLALALGACSTPAPRSPAPVTSGWPGCDAIGAFAEPGAVPPYPAGAVPDGFVPQRAVLCQTATRDSTGGGTRTVNLERTATDVGPLLTYLAQPDEKPTGDACSADAWLPPWLFLLDSADRFVRPAIPVDGCGKPLGYRERDGLPWLTLAYTDRER